MQYRCKIQLSCFNRETMFTVLVYTLVIVSEHIKLYSALSAVTHLGELNVCRQRMWMVNPEEVILDMDQSSLQVISEWVVDPPQRCRPVSRCASKFNTWPLREWCLASLEDTRVDWSLKVHELLPEGGVHLYEELYSVNATIEREELEQKIALKKLLKKKNDTESATLKMFRWAYFVSVFIKSALWSTCMLRVFY